MDRKSYRAHSNPSFQARFEVNREGAMLPVLLLSRRCVSETDKHQWEEFRKDLRGDNMKMRSDFSETRALDIPPPSLKPRD
jgi:hypothetical protein